MRDKSLKDDEGMDAGQKPLSYQLVEKFARARLALVHQPRWELHGTVVSAKGLSISISGLAEWLQIGARLRLAPPGHPPVTAEVVGFAEGLATALAFGPLEGVGAGTPPAFAPPGSLAVDASWLGRVVDPFGRPMDRRGPLRPGPVH